MEEGQSPGARFEFHEHEMFVFGRDPDCHAYIPDDPYLSRHHFMLEIRPPEVRLRDLGSRNGTFVNRKRIGGRLPDAPPPSQSEAGAAEADLAHGDRVKVGRTQFRVEIEMGEDAAPVPREPAPAMTSSALPHFEGYDVQRLLGRGTFGATYLARRWNDGELVALKAMTPHLQADAKANARFRREIGLHARLQHENVVRVEDHGECGMTFFMVMEFCEAGDALDLAKACGGRLGLDDARPILRGCLEGVAFAHGQAVVHRDLKPANVLLRRHRGRWTAKIGDFGLAKSFADSGLSGLTMTGVCGGSPAYMPREQILNFRDVTPASDVWALAATFYELLTGTLPRPVEGGQDPLRIVLEGRAVPIREHLRHLDGTLADGIDKALAARPEDRFVDAREMLAAVRRVL